METRSDPVGTAKPPGLNRASAIAPPAAAVAPRKRRRERELAVSEIVFAADSESVGDVVEWDAEAGFMGSWGWEVGAVNVVGREEPGLKIKAWGRVR